MSFINRKIISKATFALLLTATVLASCSSNDSSSTGRIKNSAINGQTCYYDNERSQLLNSAVAIEGSAAIPAQDAVAYRAKVEFKAAVQYQAKKTGTALVRAGSISAEIAARPAVQAQAAVDAREAGWWHGMWKAPVESLANLDFMIQYSNNNYYWVDRPKSFYAGPSLFTFENGRPGQDEIKEQPEIPFQAANPLKDIPPGDDIPEILAQDAIQAQDEVKAQDEVLEQAEVKGKTLDEVTAEINAVVSCELLTGAAESPTTVDSSSSSATSGPALPVCIKGAEKDGLLAGYGKQIKLLKNDADLTHHNDLVDGRNNVAGRDICTGTEVSQVVIVAVQTQVDQPLAQASVPVAVLTVEKPVVLLNEFVTEVVVAPTEVQELVAVAGFVEGTVEVQVENAEGLSDWLMIDPSSSNTVALGDGAKSITYRVTSKDISQPVVEKTIEIERLSVLSALKVIEAAVEVAAADQLALNPTLEVEKSSGSKTVIWVAILIMLLIVILVFGMQKKKKDDANSNTAA